ncbi:amidase family protein [Longimicrobium sp.]|jgi:Asp-tRNA(Asn)/Glu-tRNA(Gln) amidotransferase A subunit family amidase|uniref:amidase family protein n=1 Tax=Longimicrobium sp. TaxID=2029185 RepID=UPI002F93D10F
MRSLLLGWLASLAIALPLAAGSAASAEAQAPRFEVREAGIEDIHRAFRDGRLTARALVEAHLARIDAYDRRGPYLNSLITVNPDALAVADSLDRQFRRTGRFMGPLHGIPVIVKDNYDTRDLPTTAGSLALAGSVPPDDAFQVRRLREAGAIVLAKSNMAEFAFTPYETVGSMLPGYTRNPYDLTRGTAGSSGGTAAAVAASLGVVGLGTDTGNSIRGPASHAALVGIRSTMGLTSRDGIVPLYLDRDVGGPMARTVADAVRVLDVIAGHDPADPVTAESRGRLPREGYAAHLRADGLRGKRIGVVRQLSNTPATDTAVLARFEEALRVMRSAGAEVVDVQIPELDTISGSLWCGRFKTDINAYLASLGPRAPVKNLDEIVASGKFHPSIAGRLREFQRFTSPEEDEACREAVANVPKLRAGVRAVLSAGRLHALVYPTWSNPPRLIGDLNTPHGNNSWQLSPPTGFPAISVPMGYVQGSLPTGLQILGDAWSEPVLIQIGYAFEQATRHRRPPESTPPL